MDNSKERGMYHAGINVTQKFIYDFIQNNTRNFFGSFEIGFFDHHVN